MFSSQPYPPTVTWTTTNTNTTIPSGVMPTATVSVQPQYTPTDVADYLMKMDFRRVHTSTGEAWRTASMNGFMTWEQAVVYCLVKPWLTDNDDGAVQTNA